MKKKTHGGARKGAGRPKTKEDTIVIRVPKSLVEDVRKMIKAPASVRRMTKDSIRQMTIK